MRKLLMLFVTLLVIVSISLFADPIILKAADDHAEGYPTVEALKFMGKIIEIMTNGKYKIEVYPSAQLGSEKRR